MFSLASWHSTFRRSRLRKKLRDPQYGYLFESPAPHEYVCLDCETSSLDPKNAELLSIAAVRIVEGCVVMSEALELIVRPQGSIDPRTIPIHGLRSQDVRAGLSPIEAMALLLPFIGARPIIGYYLEFDLAILNRIIKPWLGIPLPNPSIEVSSLYYDLNVSAYRPEVDLSLEAITTALDLPLMPRHNPLFDALTAAIIWLKLQKKE